MAVAEWVIRRKGKPELVVRLGRGAYKAGGWYWGRGPYDGTWIVYSEHVWERVIPEKVEAEGDW